MATLLGTTGNFGFAADETGFIVEAASHETRNEKVYTRSRQGNRQGVSYYDESIVVRTNGLMASTAAFSTDIATSWTLGNAVATTHLKEGATGTLVLESVTRGRQVDGFETLELSGEYLPFVS